MVLRKEAMWINDKIESCRIMLKVKQLLYWTHMWTKPKDEDNWYLKIWILISFFMFFRWKLKDMKDQDIPNLHMACYDLDLDKVVSSLSLGESVDIYRSSVRGETPRTGFLKQHFTTEYGYLFLFTLYNWLLNQRKTTKAICMYLENLDHTNIKAAKEIFQVSSFFANHT